MTESTHAELNRIVTAACALCIHKDSDLDAEGCPCNACQWPIDLANLVEKLEEKQTAQPLIKEGTHTRKCPRCGALYGLSCSRIGEDTEYCYRCGQLTSGWMARSVHKRPVS